MKPTSKRGNKPFPRRLLPALLLPAVLLTLPLRGDYPYKITEPRGDYFLITQKKPQKFTIAGGDQGYVSTAKQGPRAGTFRVLEASGNQWLCRLTMDSPGPPSNKMRWAVFPAKRAKPPDPPPPPRFAGVTFTPLDKGGAYYISLPPVPLGAIRPPNPEGIKKFLTRIETETGGRFRATLTSVEHIRRFRLDRRFDFSDKNTIFLGLMAGRLSMLYEENRLLRHTPISTETMNKYNDTMYVPVLLTRKTGKRKKP